MTSEISPATSTTIPSTSTRERLILAAAVAALVGAAVAIVLNAIVMFAPAAGKPGLVAYPQAVDDYRSGQIVFAATQLLMGIGLFAMIRCRRAPLSGMGRVGGWLAIVGWAITVPGEIIIGVVADQSVDSDAATVATTVYGVGVLLADIGLILFGIAVIRSRSWWLSWRPLPLILGVVQLVVVTPVLLVIGFIGVPAFAVLVVQDVLVALIGVALLRNALSLNQSVEVG